ncbi:hypothetical protein JVU11DRAFT_3971 [Chiua virens]|nr:hypothetical protein JVU11DRAFT_3971 [Chiua virens]
MQAPVAPLPYYHHADVDNDDTEPDDEFIFHWAHICELEKHLEPGIDEISPDEDDRAAEVALGDPELYHEEEDTQFGNANPHFDDSLIDPALHAESQGQSGEDVLHAHYRHNGFPCAPSPEQLHSIHDQQQLTVGNSGSAAGNTEITIVAITGHTQAAAQDSMLVGHPTKLQSYPFGFRQVIERAKLIAHEVLLGCENIPPGKSILYEFALTHQIQQATGPIIIVHSASWYAHLETILIKLMTIQLWEALMTWHSTIKSKAHEIVLQFYDVGPTHDTVHNQLQASMLIKGAEFLRNGIDDEGSMNNMAHPALAALITGFFYSALSLNLVFPEVFSCEIPNVAMCLVATALRAALNEYTQTGTQQDRQFNYATYSKVFIAYLDMQCQIDESLKHAVKTKVL